MNKIKLAVGVKDLKSLSNSHFGDSNFYLIYEMNIDNKKIVQVDTIENKTLEYEEDEVLHGDPKKASKVSVLLKDVTVVMAHVFGPNIMKIKKKFIPIISKEKNLQLAMSILAKNLNLIEDEIKRINSNNKEGNMEGYNILRT